MNVKRIFFISKEDAKELRKKTGDGYITHEGPQYELEDGTIMYAKIGYPDPYIWYAEANKGANFESTPPQSEEELDQ